MPIFNFLDGKGGRNKIMNMNTETSFSLKLWVAWRAEECTFCYLHPILHS